MNRGLSTLALLCGTVFPLSAFAQAEAPEQAPPVDDTSVPLTEDPASPTEGPANPGPADPGAADTESPVGEATPVTLDEEAAPAPPEAPAAETKPAPAPDYSEDAALDPEVYYEGDSDSHNPGYVPGYGGYRGLGLSPWAPRFGSMPGGTTAPQGSDTWDEEWAFTFHGYLESTLRAGKGRREQTVDGQSESVWHSTPIVPGRFGDFEATQAVPGPWVQMNFTYGNPYVSATAIVAGFNQQSGASYNYPSSQLGINDVYLTLRMPRIKSLRMSALVGAFQDRYGAMAQYSEGLYGHSIVAYTRGTGVTVTGDFNLVGDLVGVFEVGFKGSLDKAPLGIEPNDSNAFADSQNGAGYLPHAHFGVVWGELDIAAHYLYAFSRDVRVPTSEVRPGEGVPSDRPDGSIETMGLTVRAVGEPYGHLMVGGAYTKAENARNVPRVINILNADGGRGLMEEYFGMRSGGNGELLVAGFQYDVSLQKILHYPTFFNGNSWDVRASFFGTYAHVTSDQKNTQLAGFTVNFDDVDKLKVGSEITYNFLPWMGVSTRYDFVGPDLADGDRSYHIISPKILFRTSFLAHEQFNIRYTRWFYGDRVLIQSVAPNDPQGLDEQMLALQANMYW